MLDVIGGAILFAHVFLEPYAQPEPSCFNKPDVVMTAPGGGYQYSVGACELEHQQEGK